MDSVKEVTAMKEKRILFVTRMGAKIKREKGRITVYLKDYELHSIPIAYIWILIVFGNVEFTNPALTFLMHHNVPIYFMTYSAKLKGVLFPQTALASNYSFRLKQYDALLNRRVEIAKWFIKQKIIAIDRYFSLPNKRELLLLLEEKNTIEGIMGIEGVASSQMFRCFRESLTCSDFPFFVRAYHPPPDEVNTVLSMGYTVIYSSSLPILLSSGFDPFISFLHKKRGKEYAFALDVMEPIRPVVTKDILLLFNKGFFEKGDFERDAVGYKFTRCGMLKFLNWMNKKVEKYINIINDEIRALKEVL